MPILAPFITARAVRAARVHSLCQVKAAAAPGRRREVCVGEAGEAGGKGSSEVVRRRRGQKMPSAGSVKAAVRAVRRGCKARRVRACSSGVRAGVQGRRRWCVRRLPPEY